MKELNKKLEQYLEAFKIQILPSEESELEGGEVEVDEIEQAQMYVTNFLDNCEANDKLVIEQE